MRRTSHASAGSPRRPAKPGLLQRIDRNVDVMRDRLTGVEEIADAARALLVKLSPEQQGSADPRLANLMLLPLAGMGAGAPGAGGRPGPGVSPGGGPDAPRGARIAIRPSAGRLTPP